MQLRHLAAPTIVLVLAATLTACGSDSSTSSSDNTAPGAVASLPADSTSSGSTTTTLNAADVAFAQGMIAHHEQAIEMAEIALDPTRGASTEVTDLATRIEGAQGPEVELMTGWLTAAGEPITMDSSEGHDMDSMDGMMTADEMDALGAATGTEFDEMWLEMMIAHHEGAIAQSEAVKADGANAEVLGLADQIIIAQQAEITEMESLLGG